MPARTGLVISAWGIFGVLVSTKSKLDDKKGTSLVLVNNAKGKAFWQAISNELAICQQVPLAVACKGNPILLKASREHPSRAVFFERFEKTMSTTELIEDVLAGRNVGVMNFHYSDFNFGAVMVPYSLCKSITKLGYNARVINYVPARKARKADKNNSFEDFRNNFMELTTLCTSEKELRQLNKHIDKFIVGSDQVWRWHDNYKYLFNWVFGQKTLISYAPSFGKASFPASEKELNDIQALLSRFDAVSIREKNGVGLCKNLLTSKRSWFWTRRYCWICKTIRKLSTAKQQKKWNGLILAICY